LVGLALGSLGHGGHQWWYFAAGAGLAVLSLAPEIAARVRAAERVVGDDLEIPAALAPLVLILLPAVMGHYSTRIARVLLELVAIAIVALVVAFVRSYLPPNKTRVLVGVVGFAIVLVGAQIAIHDTDTGRLGPVRWLVRLSLFAWYLGISLWLIRRLVVTAGTMSKKRINRLIAGTVVATAVIPAAVVYTVPRFWHGATFGWWLGILAIPSFATTLAVFPRWAAVISGAALALHLPAKTVPIIIFAVTVIAAIAIRQAIEHQPTAARLMRGADDGDTRGLFDSLSRWTRAVSLAAAILALAATGAAAIIYTPVGRTAITANSPGTWHRANLSRLERRFSPELYLEASDHQPTAVCSYVLAQDAPATRRDAATDNSCLSNTQDSAARRSDGPDTTLTARTYAVVASIGPTEDGPYCVGRPSQRCPAVVGTSLVIEYWLFYDRDNWHAQTALGQIVQSHDADWEVVLVGFKKRPGPRGTTLYRPQWAAFSEHCGGSWLPWSAVTRDKTHPLAWVARGSHANYPSGRERSPNWASCVKPATIDRFVDVMSFSAAVIETLPERTAKPVQLHVVESKDSIPFLTQLKPLGHGETIAFFGFRTRATEKSRTTAIGKAPGDGIKGKGIKSPLDPGRTIGRHPLAIVFGPKTLWRCNALVKICRLRA
jgi:hypothetical protein